MTSPQVRIPSLLITSINFAPEDNGIGVYTTDLASFLSEEGHQVTVVTAFPYYPVWRKLPEHRRKFFAKENYNGIELLRGYLFVPRVVSSLRRILHESTFVAFAFLNFFRARKHSVIIVLSPPLLLGLIGVLFKRLWNARLIFHVQDIQPDSALALKMVKRTPLIRALLRLERWIYTNSDLVVSISEGMVQRIVSKGVDERKVVLVPNWITLETPYPLRAHGRFRETHGIDRNTFVVAYSGNLGVKQGVDVLLHAAKLLRNDEGILVLIVGDGADRDRLSSISAGLNLTNVWFLPMLDRESYVDMLTDIDLSFVGQRTGTGNVFFPSKLLPALALGTPVVVATDPDSELNSFVERTKAGCSVAAGDAEALASTIRSLTRSPDLLRIFGSNGSRSAQSFSRSSVLGAYRKKIYALLDS